MPSRVIDILVKASADKSAAQEGARSLMLLKNSIDAAQASMERLGGDSTAKIRAEYIALGEAGKAVQRELDIQDIAEKYYNLGQILGQDEELLIRLRKAMKDVGATEDEVNRATRAFKELQAQAQGANDATSGKGLTLGRTERLVGQFGSAASALNLPFGSEISSIGNVLQLLNSAKEGLAGIGPAAEIATTGSTAAAGGLTAIATAAAPLLLILAPLGASILLFSKLAEQAKNNLAIATSGVGRATSTAEFFADISSGTSEEGKNKILDRGKERDRLTVARDYVQGKLDQTLNDEINRLVKLGYTLDEAKDTAQTYLSTDDTFKAGQAAVKQYNEQIVASNEVMNAGFFAIQSGATAAADATAEAQAKQEKSTADLIKSIQNAQQVEQTHAQLLSLSSDAARERQTELKAEQKDLEAWIAQIEKSGDTSQAASNKLTELKDALDKNKDAQAFLRNTALQMILTRETEAEATRRAKQALEDYNKTLEQAGDVQSQIGADRAARDKQLKRRAEDDAIAAERKGVEADFKERIAEAKKNQAIDKLNADFFDSELKALDDFHTQETKSDDKAAKNRLRLLEDAADDLFDAAARNDVVAFLNRQRQAEKDLRRQNEDTDEASKDRLEAYLKERQQAQDHYTEQLQILTDAGQERNNRASQLEQELNDIREQWRIDDINRQRTLEEEDFQERMALAQARYAELLALADSFFQQWKRDFEANAPGTTVMPNGEYPTFNTRRGNVTISRFATGADYIPYDKFPAYLDEGEAVLTKREAKEWRGGGGKPSKTYNIAVNNTVGDIATKSMLDEAIVTTVTNLTKALDDESDE